MLALSTGSMKPSDAPASIGRRVPTIFVEAPQSDDEVAAVARVS
jgi:hypothetical protein